MFGDGSDGALNVASGTTNLNLDQKYQFTTVNVASGATLSTASTSGSVLYILANTSITINGTINVSNIVNRGQNTWSVTIDGDTYTSPGTGNGGKGGDNQNGALGGAQGSGYGGGGAGAYSINLNATYYRGGHGGTGAASGSGGAGASFTTVAPNSAAANGSSGVGFGGGGGVAVSVHSSTSTGGNGGNTPGANGSNASASGVTYSAGGGGGAGGQPGRPGVHLVLKSPSIIVNGTIITSGTDGQFGGDGGVSVNNVGSAQVNGSGGGGGGGGSAGNVYITTSSLSDASGTYTMARGLGYGGGLGFQQGVAGEPGVVGSKNIQILSVPFHGPFVRVWNGSSWVYSRTKARTSTRFGNAKVKVQ